MVEYSEEDINSEEDIIDIIKNNDLNIIKEIFKYINENQLNGFKKALFYLIKEHFSINVIDFFIEKLRQYHQQHQSINSTELLFHSIECSNYEIAKQNY